MEVESWQEKERARDEAEVEGAREQNAGIREHSGKAPSVIQLCDAHKFR